MNTRIIDALGVCLIVIGVALTIWCLVDAGRWPERAARAITLQNETE
jgi:uncharacterized membrane protein YccC